MLNPFELFLLPAWMLLGLGILAVWESIWKGIGLWYSAQNKQKGWFVCILIFNTLGLLPIVYLLWFKPEEKRTLQRKIQKKK